MTARRSCPAPQQRAIQPLGDHCGPLTRTPESAETLGLDAFLRPVSTLCEPCILLEDLIEEEGLPAVIRAVARGLVLYDAGNAILVCRSRFDLMAESGVLGEVA